MSLTAPLARLDRYGFVNTFILALVIAPLLPSALADVVASVLLATFVVVGTARRAGRRQWSTWVAAGVLALRIGSCFQCFHPFLDHLLPNTLLHQSFLPSEPAVLRSLLPRVAWKAVVYYVLLRGAPALAPMAPIAFPVLTCGIVVLPMSLLFFGTSTTAVLLFETARATKRRVVGKSSETQALINFRGIAQHQLTTDELYRQTASRLDDISAREGVDLSDLEPTLRELRQPWLHLQGLADDELKAVCQALNQRHATSPVNDPRFSDVDAKMLLPTLGLLRRRLHGQYASRPAFMQDSSLLSVTYQIAGVVVRYLLPIPFLRHLAKPFRRELLGHLVLTPFIFRYLIHPSTQYYTAEEFYTPEGARSCSPPPPALAAMLDALAPFFLAAQGARVRSGEAAEVLGAYLEAVERQGEAVRAEETSHQAVLDAVLFWWRRKEERERVRGL